MSLVIHGSEYHFEEYLKGMNWFIISWTMFEEIPKWLWGVSECILVLNFVSYALEFLTNVLPFCLVVFENFVGRGYISGQVMLMFNKGTLSW